jgi:putative radical SAM enzyme (TIGR03279 family)
MAQKGVQVIAVELESLAEAAGIQPGDTLLQINGEKVLDQLNYQFLMSQKDETTVLFQKPDGMQELVEIENGGEGMGVDLAADEVKVCKQNCVFCFVHQMPKGYRKSLYLKDEDIRLSFLYGHFSTLSSSDDAELDRIVRERLSPIHVSVHATDPEVRVKVVGNPREGHILKKIDRLLEGGIDVHTQVVVAPDLNDGWVWDKTIRELWERRAFQSEGPWAGKGGVLSLSCVPVGLTVHREGLPDVKDVDEDFAKAWVKRWTSESRRYAAENGGEPWLLLADEWFTRAKAEVPGRRFYSASWAQLENGVGMIRKFLEHSRRFIKSERAKDYAGRKVLILTGSSFAPVLNRTLMELNRSVGSQIRAIAVRNNDFGESVTVAGLLTGQDLKYAAHADRDLHQGRPDWVDAVIVPSASLRTHTGPTDQYTLHGTTVRLPEGTFLDDMAISDLSADLNLPVLPSGANLSQLLDHLEAAERAAGPALRRRDLREIFHAEGLNAPQGAYNP